MNTLQLITVAAILFLLYRAWESRKPTRESFTLVNNVAKKGRGFQVMEGKGRDTMVPFGMESDLNGEPTYQVGHPVYDKLPNYEEETVQKLGRIESQVDDVIRNQLQLEDLTSQKMESGRRGSSEEKEQKEP